MTKAKVLYCDGSGADKYGVSRLCVVVGDKVVVEEGFGWTSNVAEYEALLKAIELANDGDKIFTDSKLVLMQTVGDPRNNKVWRVKAKHLRPLRDAAIAGIKEKRLELAWIPREINLAGKVLEKVLRRARR